MAQTRPGMIKQLCIGNHFYFIPRVIIYGYALGVIPSYFYQAKAFGGHTKTWTVGLIWKRVKRGQVSMTREIQSTQICASGLH